MLNTAPISEVPGGKARNPSPPKIENEGLLYGGSIHIQLGAFGRKQHAYFLPERGVFVPGVTTILKRLDKPALINWAANQAADYVRDAIAERVEMDEAGQRKADVTLSEADVIKITDAARKAHQRTVKDAGDVGKQIHSLAEQMFKGELIDLPANADYRVRNGLDALRSWIADNDVMPIEPERIIHSRRWFYCGMCDLLATVNGALAIVDFKTSKGVWPEHRLQTAAYQVALEEELGEPINDRHIIRLDKFTGEVDPHYFPRSNLEIDAFLRVREVHELMTKLENEAA